LVLLAPANPDPGINTTLSSLHPHFTFHIQSLKMELIVGSETSANQNMTPEKYPKENIHYSEHGESLKSRIQFVKKICTGFTPCAKLF
jgi:hypothetical protein